MTPNDSIPQNSISYEPPLGRRFGNGVLLALGTLILSTTTLLFSGILHSMFSQSSSGLPRILGYFAAVIIDRGPIPYIEVFFFWLAMISLLSRRRARRRENDRFLSTCAAWKKIRERIIGGSGTVPAASADALLTETDAVLNRSKLRDSMAGKRLFHAVRRFSKTKSSREVDDILNTLSNMDASSNDTAYSNLRFLVWLIPTLGFIGTVLGIGLGIAGFGRIIEQAASFRAVQQQIPHVTHNLGIAFDTTLLALFLTAIVLAIMSYVQRRDENLLSQIDTFCVEEIAGSFEETEALSEKLETAMAATAEDLTAYLDDKIVPPDLARIETLVGHMERHLGRIAQESGATKEALLDIQSRIDLNVSTGVDAIGKAIRESSDATALREALHELRSAASSTAETIQASFQEFLQGVKTTTDGLSYTADKLRDFVEKGGVSEATEFTATVNELKVSMKPVAEAVSGFREASQRLDGLSQLVDTAGKLEHASTMMERAAQQTQKGGGKMADASTNLSSVISSNKEVLDEVKTVLESTTSSIRHLSDIISKMNYTLSGMGTAVSGVQQAIQIIVDQVRGGAGR